MLGQKEEIKLGEWLSEGTSPRRVSGELYYQNTMIYMSDILEEYRKYFKLSINVKL